MADQAQQPLGGDLLPEHFYIKSPDGTLVDIGGKPRSQMASLVSQIQLRGIQNLQKAQEKVVAGPSQPPAATPSYGLSEGTKQKMTGVSQAIRKSPDAPTPGITDPITAALGPAAYLAPKAYNFGKSIVADVADPQNLPVTGGAVGAALGAPVGFPGVGAGIGGAIGAALRGDTPTSALESGGIQGLTQEGGALIARSFPWLANRLTKKALQIPESIAQGVQVPGMVASTPEGIHNQKVDYLVSRILNEPEARSFGIPGGKGAAIASTNAFAAANEATKKAAESTSRIPLTVRQTVESRLFNPETGPLTTQEEVDKARAVLDRMIPAPVAAGVDNSSTIASLAGTMQKQGLNPQQVREGLINYGYKPAEIASALGGPATSGPISQLAGSDIDLNTLHKALGSLGVKTGGQWGKAPGDIPPNMHALMSARTAAREDLARAPELALPPPTDPGYKAAVQARADAAALDAAMARQHSLSPITDALNAAYGRGSGSPSVMGYGMGSGFSNIGRPGAAARVGLLALNRPYFSGLAGRGASNVAPFVASPQLNANALRTLAMALAQSMSDQNPPQ